MKPSALLQRLSSGSIQNVAFRDACALLEATGFHLSRISGSHHVFRHPEIPELINLQDARGEAKPYQLRQFLRLVERYNLKTGTGS